MLDWNYGGAPLWGPDASSRIKSYQDNAASKEAEYQRQQAERKGQDYAKVERAQMESDREFKLKLDNAKREAETIAISKGQAKANEWYQKETIKLTKERLQQEQRQFEMTFGENQRQFNVGASGYLDGKPTLAREAQQDSSLFNWTKEAIGLASKPADWVKLRRMQSGVADNISSMPGLNWAAGGQVGNTTFAGQPQSNSLQNVMQPMGINVGQGAATGTPAASAASGDWASQAAQQAQSIASAPLNLDSSEQQIYNTAREFAMNPQGAAPGWYENLDPMTRDLLTGAAEAQGLDWASTMSRYKRSRWGGGGSAAAA